MLDWRISRRRAPPVVFAIVCAAPASWVRFRDWRVLSSPVTSAARAPVVARRAEARREAARMAGRIVSVVEGGG